MKFPSYIGAYEIISICASLCEMTPSFFFSYELQVSKSYQGKGLGRYLMTLLEALARHYQMKKVMLTVLKRRNPKEIDHASV
jgi:GNAT superfamily N-acetyltransferase